MSISAFSKIKPHLQTLAPSLYSQLLSLRNRFVTKKMSSYDFFTSMYLTNGWGGKESLSGQGSDSDQTKIISREIPLLIKEFGIKTMLDAPCGDLHWISKIDLGLEKYIGSDIVAPLIENNTLKYGGKNNRQFVLLDITKDTLPQVDMILCRDCLVHLPLKEVLAALKNFKKCGAKYLLTTTLPLTLINREVIKRNWRPLNFTVTPFNFPEPLRLIHEGSTENDNVYRFADKSLGLWELDSIKLLKPLNLSLT